jgi:type IV secretory pathway TrbF-like protein
MDAEQNGYHDEHATLLKAFPHDEDEGDGGVSDELATYLMACSAQEQVALRHAAQWKAMAFVLGTVALAAVVLAWLILSRQTVIYKLVGLTEDGRVRIQSLPLNGWTLDQLTIRAMIIRWVRASHQYGVDPVHLAAERLFAWSMAKGQVQQYLTKRYQRWPMEKVGKQTIAIERIRTIPPTHGRTWEVYWAEVQTDAAGAVSKNYVAWLTIIVKHPATEADDGEDALHLGVWVETIGMEERPIVTQ